MLSMRILFVVAAGLALAGCGDMFSPPPLPDLHKEPYDFAVVVPPYRDGGVADDLKGDVHDLAMGNTTD